MKGASAIASGAASRSPRSGSRPSRSRATASSASGPSRKKSARPPGNLPRPRPAVPFRLALLLVLLSGVFIACLASFNSGGVTAIGRDWTHDLPLIALVVGAFLVGAMLALVLG